VVETLNEYATNRELALLFWMLVALSACLAVPGAFDSMGSILRILLSWNILLPLVAYVLYLCAVVWIGWTIGGWTHHLLGATVLWVLLTGFALLFGAVSKAAEEQNYFKGQLRKAIEIAVLLEFVVNLSSLALWAELLLQPVVLALVLLQFASEGVDNGERLASCFGTLVAATGFALLVWTIVDTARHWDTFDGAGAIRELLLPIWLGVAAIPLAYLFAVFAGYESLLKRLNWMAENRRVPLRVRLGLASVLAGDLQDLNGFAGRRGYEAVRERTFRGARRQVRAYRDEVAADKNERARNAASLVANVGITGVDSSGRQLDRREFAATKKALEWLWTCHAGRYKNHGRYQKDLLDLLDDFSRQGLPQPHGIVMRMNKHGTSWYAYRRTATGWVFGIGAAGEPNDQWFFDGPQPPEGFPGSDAKGWSPFMADARTEWLPEPRT
jgi:hypothetical protein